MWESFQGTSIIHHVWKAYQYPNEPGKWLIESYRHPGKFLTGYKEVIIKDKYPLNDSNTLRQKWTIVSPGRNSGAGITPTVSLKTQDYMGWLKHKDQPETLGSDNQSYRMTMWTDSQFVNEESSEDKWTATLLLTELERCPR